MKGDELLAKVTIKVSFRSAGNIINNKDVDFEIWKDGISYRALPQLSVEQRRLASIPQEMTFEIKDGKVETPKGNKDGNLQVVKDIAAALKMEQKL